MIFIKSIWNVCNANRELWLYSPHMSQVAPCDNNDLQNKCSDFIHLTCPDSLCVMTMTYKDYSDFIPNMSRVTLCDDIDLQKQLNGL